MSGFRPQGWWTVFIEHFGLQALSTLTHIGCVRDPSSKKYSCQIWSISMSEQIIDQSPVDHNANIWKQWSEGLHQEIVLWRHFFARLDISWTIFSPADICVSRPTTWKAQYRRLNRWRCCSNFWKIETHCPDCASSADLCGHCGMEFLRWKSEIYIFDSFWLLFQGILGIWGHPLVPGFQNIWSSRARGDGMLPRKGFAHLPGYLNGPTVGIDGEQGGVGEINIRLTALASSEGSFASRCHSKKLGKCRTPLYQGLILTRRTGQTDQHSTHQVEVWRQNEID